MTTVLDRVEEAVRRSIAARATGLEFTCGSTDEANDMCVYLNAADALVEVARLALEISVTDVDRFRELRRALAPLIAPARG